MSEVIVKRAEGKLKSNLNKLNVDLGDQYSKSWMDKDAFGVTAYLVKCLGCASAGFPPQYITKSALFLTSPKVILGSPTP